MTDTGASTSSRPIYSPLDLLSLQSRAAQRPISLPDLPCISTASPPVALPSLPPGPPRRGSSQTGSIREGELISLESLSSKFGGGASAPGGLAGKKPSSSTSSRAALGSSISSSSDATQPVPLFQSPRMSKVIIRSPDSTTPSTISPASPRPVASNPTYPPGFSSPATYGTPLFQQARAARVSIKIPSSSSLPREDPVVFTSSTKIPGGGGGAHRPVIAPSLPSSSSTTPAQEKTKEAAVIASLVDRAGPEVVGNAKPIVSPSSSVASIGLGVDLLDLSFEGPSAFPNHPPPVISANPDDHSAALPSSPSKVPPPLPTLQSTDEASCWDLPSSSSLTSIDPRTFETASGSELPEATTPSPRQIQPLKSATYASKVAPSPSREEKQPISPSQSPLSAFPTPPTSPSTPVVSSPVASTMRAQRAAGSTPSGRMIAGALGLARDRSGGSGGLGGSVGSGGYVRPEVKTERKLTGQELDDKIKKIRDENRRIEAAYQKEDLDTLAHSPTRSREASFDEQQSQGSDHHQARASAQRRLSQAETEIERLKRELGKAVQTKIDTEREVARELKLKALGAGSLDWDASKNLDGPDPQSLPYGKQPSPIAFNRDSPLASPYKRPSRPRFPSNGGSSEYLRSPSLKFAAEEKDDDEDEGDDGGWGGGGGGRGDATPTTSAPPISASASSIPTPRATPVKVKSTSLSSSGVRQPVGGLEPISTSRLE